MHPLRMSLKLQTQNQAWYRDLGQKAKRCTKLIENHSSKARLQWIKLGEYGVEVKDSATPRSGILDRWRVEYLDGRVHKVELSDAIWCYEHPVAIKLVRETITNPQNIRSAHRDIAKEAAANFIEAGRNDVSELAEQLGLFLPEADKLLRKAQSDKQGVQVRQANAAKDKRQTELDAAVTGSTGIMYDDPIGDTDLTGNAAIRQALAELDAFDVKAARQTLLKAPGKDKT